MVRIRLRRVGAKNQPSYRIVVTDQRNPRDGSFIEVIGFYNPRTDPSTIEIDVARVLYWLDKGAQPSDSVVQVMKSHGTYDRVERLRAGEPLETLLAELEAQPEEQAEQAAPAAEEPETEEEKEKEAVPAASEVHAEAEDSAEVEAAAEVGTETEAE